MTEKNRWTREIKGEKDQVSETEQIVDDKFEKLLTNKTKGSARVSIGVSEGMAYGALKVSATVSVNCDQTEQAINTAGELAFLKAVELVRDGWSVMDGRTPSGKQVGP